MPNLLIAIIILKKITFSFASNSVASYAALLANITGITNNASANSAIAIYSLFGY